MRNRDYRKDAKMALSKMRLRKKFSHIPHLLSNTPIPDREKLLIDETRKVLTRMYDESRRGKRNENHIRT